MKVAIIVGSGREVNLTLLSCLTFYYYLVPYDLIRQGRIDEVVQQWCFVVGLVSKKLLSHFDYGHVFPALLSGGAERHLSRP